MRDGTAPVSEEDRGTTLPVTVVIPAYNREGMLRRALASVNAQRPAVAAEVIVVDDGSSDGTAAVARELGARVITHDRNRGAAAARNTAVAAATQPWIAPLDSDDEWLPHHLDTLWRLRQGHVLVAGSSVRVHDDAWARWSVHGTDRLHAELIESPARVLVPYNPLPASAVIVRRDAIREAGGYDTGLGFAEDWDLWLRVLEHGTAVQSPEIITVYHLHAGQKTRDVRGSVAAQRRVADRCRARPWWTDELADRRRAVLAWDELRAAARAGRARPVAANLAFLLSSRRRAGEVASLVMRRRRLRARAADLAGQGSHAIAAPGTEAATRAETGDIDRHTIWKSGGEQGETPPPTAEATTPRPFRDGG